MSPRAWIFVGLVLSAACEDRSAQTTLIDAPRCGDPQGPAVLSALSSDAHRAAFFAAHPLPQLQNQGGPILHNPRVTAVFFADDPMRAETEAFLQTYGCSDPYHQSVAEYGVGDASYERSVRFPTFPALPVPSNAGLETWIRASLDEPRSEDDLLMLFVPAEAKLPGACFGFYGFHAELVFPDRNAPYAVVVDCSSGSTTLDALSVRTHVASHELIEAALDPRPLSWPAWVGTDMPSWGSLDQESADLCEGQDSALDYPLPVAMGWSNRRARAGHDPCAATDAPFAVAMPRQPSLDLASGAAALDVDVYADDPTWLYQLTAAPWTNGCVSLSVDDSVLVDGTSTRLSLSTGPPCMPGLPPGGEGERISMTLTPVDLHRGGSPMLGSVVSLRNIPLSP